MTGRERTNTLSPILETKQFHQIYTEIEKARTLFVPHFQLLIYAIVQP